MGGSSSSEIDRNSPEAQFVDNMIHDKVVVVFSKTHCPYCKMAKDVFDELQARYEVVELDQRGDGSTIQRILGQMTGASTVPRVFIQGKCIGGGQETKAMYKSGKLEKWLRECGAVV